MAMHEINFAATVHCRNSDTDIRVGLFFQAAGLPVRSLAWAGKPASWPATWPPPACPTAPATP